MSNSFRRSALRPFTFIVLAVLVAFLAGVILDIDLPGVYMDAVNPDYLVVPILHPTRPIEASVLPGNYIAHRLPILTSFYHGTEQVWLGLPFFALLGTSVVSLRLVHGIFGCAVLACALWWMRRAGVKPALIALIGVALAVDPAFVFAFRTQSYITLAPVAWLLLSLIALDLAATRDDVARFLFRSGAAFGLAFFGYFIYLFYLPAVLIAVTAWPLRAGAGMQERSARLRAWGKGFGVGSILYAIGYALMLLHYKSLPKVAEKWHGLNVFADDLDIPSKIAYGWAYLSSFVRGSFHETLMLGKDIDAPGVDAKLALLMGVPIALWIIAELRRTSDRYLRITLACGVSFFLCALIFGKRLGGHHYASLLVLAYVALACGFTALMRTSPKLSTAPWRGALALVPLVAVVAVNLSQQVLTRERLRETGGVGYYSDAINQLAADALRDGTHAYYLFPDWGLSLSFGFLTAGRVQYTGGADYEEARRMLCAGSDVRVALFVPDRSARYADWARRLGWSQPVVVPYRQRDGVVAFEVAEFRVNASDVPDPCHAERQRER